MTWAAIDLGSDVIAPTIVIVLAAVLITIGHQARKWFNDWRAEQRQREAEASCEREQRARDMKWLREQVEANGAARAAGTDNQTIRETLDNVSARLDENTRETRTNTNKMDSIAEHVATVGAKLSEHLDEASTRAEMVREIEMNQRDAIKWALRTMTEFRERLDAIEHHDSRPPHLETEEKD